MTRDEDLPLDASRHDDPPAPSSGGPGVASGFDTEDYCYLTTTGRVTGNPHEIEIWFALHGNTAYIMAGDHASDWVRNARKQPAVSLRIRDRTFAATARIVTDPTEDALARRLLLAKYATPDKPLESWGRTALPIAFELQV